MTGYSGTHHRHIVKRFDEELASLRSLMLEMGGMVEGQIGKAVTALLEEDLEAAQEVIDQDHVVNGLDVRADEEITTLLARRQPMGWDLRMVMSIAKAVTDLERMGDEAEKIARMTLHMYDGDQPLPRKQLLHDVRKIGALASHMLRDCLDAFARLDVEKAVAVAQLDLDLDAEYQAGQRRIMTYVMEDARTIGTAMDVMWIIKALERVGDHAKNISEYVVYLVQGKDVRHISPSKLAENVLDG